MTNSEVLRELVNDGSAGTTSPFSRYLIHLSPTCCRLSW